MKQRLNKLIAQSGFCSRRKADELILRRKVKVNDALVDSPGFQADPDKDIILVAGKKLNLEKKIYLLLNKPTGYITTTKDKFAEKTVFDLLPKMPFRLYPVGRLDMDTSGLLILTNDGNLSYELTHPKFEVKRIYEILVKRFLEDKTIKHIERGGIKIDDYLTSPCDIKLLSRNEAKTKIELSIHEGRKRQIRKMFTEVGHPVIELKRVQFGKLKLGDLKPGHWRYIKREEIL